MAKQPLLPAIPHERLLAPRADGAILSRPPLRQGVQLARDNRQRLSDADFRLGEKSLTEFRQWSREDCFRVARQWMADTLGPDVAVSDIPLNADRLLFITGHQPQLNHAGVWMKNVAAARLAECCGGIGLNLIVDNDLAGPPVVRCPAGTRSHPRFEQIAFDDPHPIQPWEELSLQNEKVFSSFPQRVAELMQQWEIQPTLTQLWPAALSALSRTQQLSALLTACRVEQEQRRQIRNLELPVSVLCQTDPFLAFVACLCQNFEKFFADYNAAVHAFRRKYHVRNHRHPVPDLERQGERYELPFWFWKPNDRDRSRVFVERTASGIELCGADTLLARLAPDCADWSPLRGIEKLGRFRTRALTTTLFSRMCLGDLFLHGIGGARYDEITDLILTSHFQIPAPAFITLTATLHLPLEPYAATSSDVSALKNSVRDLHFQGNEQSSSHAVQNLLKRKAELLAERRRLREQGLSKSERRALRPQNRQRHLELKEIQRQLAEVAAPEIEAASRRLERVRDEVRANQVLRSREFAAALFPEEKLDRLIEDLRRQICGRG